MLTSDPIPNYVSLFEGKDGLLGPFLTKEIRGEIEENRRKKEWVFYEINDFIIIGFLFNYHFSR